MKHDDPTSFVNAVPKADVLILTSVLKRAYLESQKLAEVFPYLIGPHWPSVFGNNVRWFTDVLVNHAFQSGKLSGNAQWKVIEAGAAVYLEYKTGSLSLTFSRVKEDRKVPRKSDFRVNRAMSNQLTFGEDFASLEPANDGTISLVVTHGGRQELGFSRTLLLGFEDDQAIPVAWGDLNWALEDVRPYEMVDLTPGIMPDYPIEFHEAPDEEDESDEDDGITLAGA
jgi:hypothetical protein